MQGAALVKQASPVAWQHVNLYGRYEFGLPLGSRTLAYVLVPMIVEADVIGSSALCSRAAIARRRVPASNSPLSFVMPISTQVSKRPTANRITHRKRSRRDRIA